MKVAVIGGGAAGLSSAVFAAQAGADVTIFEHKDRVGNKIRATGNGKCNFSNTNITVDFYQTDDLHKLNSVLTSFGPDEAIDFFHSLGMLTKEKNQGLYPMTEQASTVLEVLLYRLQELGVTIHTECKITDIRKELSTFKIVSNLKSECFDRVIIACGGKSSPQSGSDGSLYVILRKLNVPMTKEMYPALVQIRAKGNFWKGISGIRIESKLDLKLNHEIIATESGELQITEYGISGIPVFQLSSEIAKALSIQQPVEVLIDFLPSITEEELQQFIAKKLKKSLSYNCEEFLVGIIHKKLIPFFLKQNGLSIKCPCASVPVSKWYELIHGLKHFKVEPSSTNGFEQAQVTVGGVIFKSVTEHMESVQIPGLFFAGEILNVNGICGGYNLHFAWASASLAGFYSAKSND